MDNRLIEKIEKYNKGLNLVKEIQPVTYSKKGSNTTAIGLVSQDVQALEPKLITRNANGILSIDYESLLVLAINAIKDLEQQVESLKQEKTVKDKLKKTVKN